MTCFIAWLGLTGLNVLATTFLKMEVEVTCGICHCCMSLSLPKYIVPFVSEELPNGLEIYSFD